MATAYLILIKFHASYYGILDEKSELAVFDVADEARASIQMHVDRVKPNERDLSKFQFRIYSFENMRQVMREVIHNNRRLRSLTTRTMQLGVVVLDQDCKKAWNKSKPFNPHLPRKVLIAEGWSDPKPAKPQLTAPPDQIRSVSPGGILLPG